MSIKNLSIKIFLSLLILALLASIFYVSFYILKMRQTENKISASSKSDFNLDDSINALSKDKRELSLKGLDRGRINILMLGIAGEKKPGRNLTDTIMISSIDPLTKQVALLSFPRDLLVEIPDTKISMKINSVYQYGLQNDQSQDDPLSNLRKIVKNISGLDIDYWIVLNFDGFIRAIDAIGGINVENSRDIYDPRYPGPNYSYETFELKKGFQHLDGTTALKYARMRHNDPEGDFGRAKRQQQILQSAKNKVFSAENLLNVFAMNDLFNALGDNIRTNMTVDEMDDFYELAKELDTRNINNVVVDAWNKDSLLKVSHVFYGDVRAFVLIPRVGNWSEVHELAENVFDLNIIKRRREEITKESATVVIINKSGETSIVSKIKKLLSENLDYKNVILIKSKDKRLEESTKVYDMTGSKMPFTLDELSARLPAEVAYEIDEKYREDIENISTDLVLVIGKDLVSRYNMEEDSIEEYNKSEDANEYSEFVKN